MTVTAAESVRIIMSLVELAHASGLTFPISVGRPKRAFSSKQDKSGHDLYLASRKAFPSWRGSTIVKMKSRLRGIRVSATRRGVQLHCVRRQKADDVDDNGSSW